MEARRFCKRKTPCSERKALRCTANARMSEHQRNQRSRARWKTVTVLVVLLWVLATSYAVVFSKQIRCQLVHWSELREVNSSLFVDPDMPPAQVAQVSSMLVEAR